MNYGTICMLWYIQVWDILKHSSQDILRLMSTLDSIFYNMEPFSGIPISLIDYHSLIILHFFLKIKYISLL